MEDIVLFLVIVLSIFLALFLLLSIILLVKAIQIANQLRSMTERANQAVAKFDSAADMMKKASGSVAIGKFLAKMADHFSNKQTKKEE